MSSPIAQLAVQLAVGIVLSLVTAWVTVTLSLRRFRREQIWNRKLAARDTVMSSLHAIKSSSIRQAQSFRWPMPSKSAQEMPVLIAEFGQSVAEIRRTLDTNAPFLNGEALRAMKDLLAQMNDLCSQSSFPFVALNRTLDEFRRRMQEAGPGDAQPAFPSEIADPALVEFTKSHCDVLRKLAVLIDECLQVVDASTAKDLNLSEK